ncbi:hypothetical protein [Hydrogenothermus marinus]|uniref:CRISPR type III-B/RAMP module-associated protein Cmr5 n=1 Tax=Hydrogenothermus marinus TaxID=133270 RepID=A0A3M0BNS6_9AQUI|nr:hypothetical protein [Hydrogenothermus marinus]RMA97949.1 hypothetical protein CLV39_0587 [Hydrogenothermus marinus]
MENLDAKINEVGYKIVEEIKTKGKDKTKYKNEIDKALSVLANDGVYAYWVYCKSKEIDDVFIKKIEELMKIMDIDYDDKEKFFEELSKDLHKLLFFKEILERTLIYARYHAKAWKD